MSNTQQVLNEFNKVVGGFTSQVDERIRTIDEQTAATRKSADTALDKIRRFRKQVIADEQMQAAHENVLRLDQVIREKFESNIKVRKTVMGVVKDFDINLCRNSTIEELSQELWITSSRYWLSFALIAISAWVNDSKTLADNAVTEAYRTNDIKSSLFFCLLNLRFGRTEVAKRWLTQYFRTVVPEDLQEETAILLQAYVNGVFGTDKSLEYEVQKVVDEWIRTINQNQEMSAELIGDYERYIQSINVPEEFKCSTLVQYCSTAMDMKTPYLESFKFAKLLSIVKSLDVESIVQNAANYKARIDAIITDLITNYDEEEESVKEQREYYQLIMDNKGDVEAAEAQFDERMKVRHKKQNFGRKLLEWAIYKTSDDVNVHVRKFAFQNSRGWFLTALENWSAGFEDKFPTEYPIKIDDWSCVSNGEDQYEHEQNFREHLEKNKYKKMYFNTPNIVMLVFMLLLAGAGAAGMFYLIPQGGLPDWAPYVCYGLFGVAALLFVIILVRCLTAGSKFRKMVNAKLAILSRCMYELTETRRVYYENLSIKDQLYSLTEHL